MNKKQEKLEEIKCINKERDAEIQQLEYSLALEEAVPDVFSDGSIKVRWSSDHPHLWPEHWTMTITKSGSRNGRAVTVHLKEHLDADWLNRIQKPSNWNRNPDTKRRLAIAKSKAEREVLNEQV